MASKSGILLERIPHSKIKENWDELILPRPIKDNIGRSILDPIQDSKHPKDSAIILFGPPGTGKTSIPLALAKKLTWDAYYISPKDFIIHNESMEFTIKDCFKKIKEKYSHYPKPTTTKKGKSKKGKSKKGNTQKA